ncbi:Fic family protein [bacterium]|nr:Fic family protein [bacterium]MBU1064396.1 Fic family protein [bacterium]MBU1873967.1 Fic family protein [bacterium]
MLIFIIFIENSAFFYVFGSRCAQLGLRFYQHFAYIHPFYDANGRIARILMIIYLLINNLTIKREPFDQSKGKFLKRLNRCHERFETDKSDQYFKYFFQFMKKFITPSNLNEDEC